MITEGVSKSPGRMVAEMLTGSWRCSPPAFGHSAAQLEELAPLLLSSGAAALCWWRLRLGDLRAVPAAEEFHQAYRLYTLRAVIQQQTIEPVIERLRAAGIEPILVKGWAVAQLYPEQGLRPCGDIDLCVPREEFRAAEAALESLGEKQYEVDLHCGFEKFGGKSADEIYARSQLARLGQTEVRVLCAEDQLRFLSVHMLREGAWRPLWLCDIAAALEARPANFDWDCCLSKNQRQAEWVICALTLAQQLLCANVKGTPAEQRNRQLPRWLVPTILKEWGSPTPSMVQRHSIPMANFLRSPGGLLKALRHRWPNPIEATIGVGGPFNNLPRLPFQLGNCLARTAKLAARLPKTLRKVSPAK